MATKKSKTSSKSEASAKAAAAKAAGASTPKRASSKGGIDPQRGN